MVGIIMIVLNVLYVCRVSVFLEPSEECVRYSRNTSTPDVPTHIQYSVSGCWSRDNMVFRQLLVVSLYTGKKSCFVGSEYLATWYKLTQTGGLVSFISRWVSPIYCENINSKNVIPVFISHGCVAEIFCTEKPKRCSLSALFEHCLRLRFEISYKRKQIRVK